MMRAMTRTMRPPKTIPTPRILLDMACRTIIAAACSCQLVFSSVCAPSSYSVLIAFPFSLGLQIPADNYRLFTDRCSIFLQSLCLARVNSLEWNAAVKCSIFGRTWCGSVATSDYIRIQYTHASLAANIRSGSVHAGRRARVTPSSTTQAIRHLSLMRFIGRYC